MSAGTGWRTSIDSNKTIEIEAIPIIELETIPQVGSIGVAVSAVVSFAQQLPPED
jgi:hypothetical protein